MKELSRRMLELLWCLGHGHELRYVVGGHYILFRVDSHSYEETVYPNTVRGLLDRTLIKDEPVRTGATTVHVYHLTDAGRQVAGVLDTKAVRKQVQP